MTTKPTNRANSGLEAQIHAAFKLWHKPDSQTSPLGHLGLFHQALAESGGNVRKATNQVLFDALMTMKKEHQRDVELLRARFLDNKAVFALANEFNVSEPTIYRRQKQAIQRLAETLREMESESQAERQAAWAERQAAWAERIPIPTYTQLIGVEGHLNALLQVLLSPGPPWLISIEGLGGQGKTSLAHQALQRLIDRGAFSDFGWVSVQQTFFHLSGAIRPVEEPILTADALIEELVSQLLADDPSARYAPPREAVNRLQGRLQQSPHLIVIDNLETLADAAGLLPLLRRLVGPTKFVLTSRHELHAEPDVHRFPVPELSEADTLRLVRREAVVGNVRHLIDADDEALRPIHQTVGGNPLALKLVVGQVHMRPLSEILEDLQEAQGQETEQLYRYIYWNAWRRLSADARSVLVLMPLFAQHGVELTVIEEVSDLKGAELRGALEHLVRLSLVNVGGDLHTRRFSIHRLTETFLLREVIKWQGHEERAM